MNVEKSYQKLIVWQRAKELVVLIYKNTSNFPKSEVYGLRSQMTRAAISIVSNIAEGYSRKSIKDKKKILGNGNWFIVRVRIGY